ncbi:hypothetical protein ACOI1C_05015 [Bacillus sp. DJP31]|uniref:hypothetical protein n=1 Tax=Bacillus sp. DJP31 TaxID=3409789 RepID=UPI003BB5A085
MKKYTTLVIICSFLLTGCLYPDDRLAQNAVAYKDQLQSVQNAVVQFREDSGGLIPIKDRDMETPIYQKYPIDFGKLVPRYIPEPPSSAFESGGIFQYVLVDVEVNPTVKLIDLRLTDEIRDLKARILVYKRSNGYPPFDKILSDKVFTVNYKELGYDEPPYAVSPISGMNLPFIINNEGEIFIDYSIDLYSALKETKHSYQSGDDIRELLMEKSDFVPVYSVPYTVENNEPVFFEK